MIVHDEDALRFSSSALLTDCFAKDMTLAGPNFELVSILFALAARIPGFRTKDAPDLRPLPFLALQIQSGR